MSFQNIIKLLKSDEQNLNYGHLKLKPLSCTVAVNWLFHFFILMYIYCIHIILTHSLAHTLSLTHSHSHSLSRIHRALAAIGLIVIAMGTGGIKPCVSAFGGDQFKEEQTDNLRRFFSLFYFSINAGSVFSTLLTPILRSKSQITHPRTQ